jgi:hypothetical protein
MAKYLLEAHEPVVVDGAKWPRHTYAEGRGREWRVYTICRGTIEVEYKARSLDECFRVAGVTAGKRVWWLA